MRAVLSLLLLATVAGAIVVKGTFKCFDKVYAKADADVVLLNSKYDTVASGKSSAKGTFQLSASDAHVIAVSHNCMGAPCHMDIDIPAEYKKGGKKAAQPFDIGTVELQYNGPSKTKYNMQCALNGRK